MGILVQVYLVIQVTPASQDLAVIQEYLDLVVTLESLVTVVVEYQVTLDTQGSVVGLAIVESVDTPE